MGFATISNIKHLAGSLNPIKIMIPKGECFVGKYLTLTNETFTKKDGKKVAFMRLFFSAHDDVSKLYYINLFGFHDRFVTGIKLLVRGATIAIMCTDIKDEKWPVYAVALIAPEKLNDIKWIDRPISTNSSEDEMPF